MDNFLKILLQGLIVLIIAAIVMLLFHFFSNYNIEWEISAMAIIIFSFFNPLFRLKIKNNSDYFKKSIVVFIALFFDLSILAALVSWTPIVEIPSKLKIPGLSALFFPLSWLVNSILKF